MEFDLYKLNIITIIVRLALAALLGGIIGYERQSRNQPAGLRTHMLISIGSALTMLTNQYVCVYLYPQADPTRIGAQVISGIGFLGVGTIIVTNRQKVRGLTTAAGLWASACMGLAVGIGFYEGAIAGGIFILFILTLLSKIDTLTNRKSRTIILYIEFDNITIANQSIKKIRDMGIKVTNLNISRANTVNDMAVGVNVTLKMSYKIDHILVIQNISEMEGICFIQEI